MEHVSPGLLATTGVWAGGQVIAMAAALEPAPSIITCFACFSVSNLREIFPPNH